MSSAKFPVEKENDVKRIAMIAAATALTVFAVPSSAAEIGSESAGAFMPTSAIQGSAAFSDPPMVAAQKSVASMMTVADTSSRAVCAAMTVSGAAGTAVFIAAATMAPPDSSSALGQARSWAG